MTQAGHLESARVLVRQRKLLKNHTTKINWGQLSQATDNVALLPDLSGTVIESNAVVFDGAGMRVRTKGAKNSNELASDFNWGGVLSCLGIGFGIGADCNGYPENAIRYDTPTWAGFSMSTSYGEDDMWDIAVKYAADWNSVKVSAAFGYTQLTDEGCVGTAACTRVPILGGGGAPLQGFRKDTDIWQVGASVMHVPTGLWAYGLWQQEENKGTQFVHPNFKTGGLTNSAANENETWFVKAGIKKAWMPVGATVLWGEWGQYNDMFSGLCNFQGNPCFPIPTNTQFGNGVPLSEDAFITGSEVQRWGVGVVQEIDSAAMHVFARWQRLSLDLDATSTGLFCPVNVGNCFENGRFGKRVNTSFEDLDIFQLGGVIFF